MNNDLVIDPRFDKPRNVIGLADPEDEGSSYADGDAAGSNGIAVPKVDVPVVDGPPQAEIFTVISQRMLLDEFGTYKVEAILEIKNDQPGVQYDVRLTPR